MKEADLKCLFYVLNSLFHSIKHFRTASFIQLSSFNLFLCKFFYIFSHYYILNYFTVLLQNLKDLL